MNYVRKLGFEESPDYDFLRDLFSKVLKSIGELDDGVFDWMLINNKQGWEAGNVRHHRAFVPGFVYPHAKQSSRRQTPAALLAQAHANAPTPRPGHREHRRDHAGGHRRTSRPQPDGTTTPPPLIVSPAPARMKESSSRRPHGQTPVDRGGVHRSDPSMQVLAPTSRRASHQQREHPFVGATPAPAAPSQHTYARVENGSMTPANTAKFNVNGKVEMMLQDPERGGVQRVPRDHDRRRGFWSVLFCRG
jgi:casein kinase 1